MCFKPLGTCSLCCLLHSSFCVPTVLNGSSWSLPLAVPHLNKQS